MELKNKLDQLLKRVEKPGRYIGGEFNSIVKNGEDVEANFAFAFPDLYEIGMSYLGINLIENPFFPPFFCQSPSTSRSVESYALSITIQDFNTPGNVSIEIHFLGIFSPSCTG